MISRLLKLLIAATLILGVWEVVGAGKIYAKAWLAQQLLERAWHRTLEGERRVRPWPWADTWPVAELTVPRLGLSQIVLSGDSGRVLAFGPGHAEASAAPGANGTTLISGHRDTSFGFLRSIQDGDIIELNSPAGKFSYTVSERSIVDQRHFSVDIPNRELQSESSLMLVTCYPFDALEPGGNERFIVLAKGVVSS